MKYFIVTCHGWSGSHWLACALNLHPDIICTHSARNLIATTDIYGEKQEELKKSVIQRKKSHQIRNSSINEIFSHIESHGKAKYYGCVHTLRLRDIVELNKAKDTKNYKLLNLVRHPVSLVESGFGQILSMSEYDIFVKTDTFDSIRNELSFFLELAEKYNLNLCHTETASFCCALYHLMHLGSDLAGANKDTSHVKMEHLVTCKEYYSNKIKELTSDSLKIKKEYLNEVFTLGKINNHKRSKKQLTPEQQFEEWEPWKKEGFSFFIQKASILDFYEKKLGYNFNFINKL